MVSSRRLIKGDQRAVPAAPGTVSEGRVGRSLFDANLHTVAAAEIS